MAAPMTADRLVAGLGEWGITYTEVSHWRTHNRNSVGPWGPVHGFVWHHTGVALSAADCLAYAKGTLYNGRPDLPGPLCHLSIGLDGMVYLVGWGRVNHAGGGDPATLTHVIAEDYTSQLHPVLGNKNGVDGNAPFYGMEIQYSGSQNMSPEQYRTALRVSAAILAHHGWTHRSVIAHAEWSKDKWDPGRAPDTTMNMEGVRADVAATLAAGPAIPTTATPPA